MGQKERVEHRGKPDPLAGGRGAEQVLEEERDDVYDRYLAYALRARQIPTGQKGSTEWVRELGAFWVGAREKRGLSRVAAARATGLSLPMIRYLELGLLFDSELTAEFFEGYGTALSGRKLYETFQQRFGLKMPSQSSRKGSGPR